MRARALSTPEGVPITLELAEGSERIGALAIDLGIMVAILVALTVMVFTLFISLQHPAAWEAGAAIWMLGFFLLRNGWFVLWEAGGRGATPGKRACKLRVAARDGGRLPFGSVLARNLLRELELFLPLTFAMSSAGGEAVDQGMLLAGTVWTFACAAIPWLNRDRLRAGDFVAGSWVVRAPRPALKPDLADMGAARRARITFTEAQLDAYGEFELQTLEEVLRREEAEQMEIVAGAIRRRIGWTGREEDAAFLSAYYAALRARLERGMLFGRRRADKNAGSAPPTSS